ncbi:MAG: hypothetical protein ACP5N2_07435 [Candidatus Nanoarchaeia archaeon]
MELDFLKDAWEYIVNNKVPLAYIGTAALLGGLFVRSKLLREKREALAETVGIKTNADIYSKEEEPYLLRSLTDAMKEGTQGDDLESTVTGQIIDCVPLKKGYSGKIYDNNDEMFFFFNKAYLNNITEKAVLPLLLNDAVNTKKSVSFIVGAESEGLNLNTFSVYGMIYEFNGKTYKLGYAVDENE